MHRRSGRLIPACCTVAFVVAVGCAPPPEEPSTNRYEDLVALFEEWRVFQQPVVVDGVPDYSADAMARQHDDLGAYLRRLAAIDTTGWSVGNQVDYHLVRA